MTKILVADDALHMRTIIELALKDYKCEVDSVENGKQAIKSYAQKQHDIVLLDLNMPIVDGIEALREIIKINKDAKVCIISVQPSPQTIEKIKYLGAKSYLSKPFDKDDIINAINEILNVKLEKKEEITTEEKNIQKSHKMLMDLKAQIIEEIKARYS